MRRALIMAIFLGTAILAGVLPANANSPANDNTFQQTSNFTAHGTPVPVPSAVSSVSTATLSCWDDSESWSYGTPTEYSMGFYIEWCASGGVIVSTNYYNSCYNLGGYWEYETCGKSHGSFNLSRLYYTDWWRYCIPYVICKTPSVVGYVYPNGTITGTWYSG